jgi:hypothetical protein
VAGESSSVVSFHHQKPSFLISSPSYGCCSPLSSYFLASLGFTIYGRKKSLVVVVSYTDTNAGNSKASSIISVNRFDFGDPVMDVSRGHLAAGSDPLCGIHGWMRSRLTLTWVDRLSKSLHPIIEDGGHNDGAMRPSYLGELYSPVLSVGGGFLALCRRLIRSRVRSF